MLNITLPDSTHSRLSGSSTHRWMACPASADAELRYKDTTGEAAAEGTVAHYIADQVLATGKKLQDFLGVTIEEEGSGLTFEVSQEMLDYIKVYTDHVSELAKGRTACYEQKLNMSWIHPDMGGTCDAMIWNESTGVLYIIDFKFGKGVMVEVPDNAQLKTYAVGGLKQVLDKTEWTADRITVVTGIVQPRMTHKAGPIREHKYGGSALMQFAEELKAAANECDIGTTYNAGKHCLFCKHKACAERNKTAREKLMLHFNDEGEPEVPELGDMTVDELDEIVQYQDFIKEWLKKAVAHATYLVENGKAELPNSKLVRRNCHRKWLKDSESQLSALFGDDVFSKKLKSPAQAEKLVKDKKLLRSFWEKPEGGFVLVDRNSPQEEVKPEVQMEFFDSHELLQ